MKTNYFTLNQQSGEHIGTIAATNDTELFEKVQIALNEHFDCNIGMKESISIDEVNAKFPYEFKIDVDGGVETIEIQQTWIY